LSQPSAPLTNEPQLPPESFDVLTLGESMALLAASTPGPLHEVSHFTRYLAGAETNVAIGLARLGLRVGWLSRLGQDAFGDFVLNAVRREGVDVSHVARDASRSTGFMLKGLSLDGQDPAIDYYRRGSAASALSVADFDAPWFASARHLHLTGISPALSASSAALVAHAMQAMRERGRSVSFDPNLRPRLWSSPEHMRLHLNALAVQAHWVLPGLAEGQWLTGQHTPAQIARFYLDQGVQAVVVKLGAQGAYVAADGFEGRVPGVPVSQVVDTVGAGDGFAAGLISARLEGRSWAEAAARGNWVGAQAVQSAGDMDGLPLRAALPAHL
jgi:sugar/nucleoside kinase (ribokinase family)